MNVLLLTNVYIFTVDMNYFYLDYSSVIRSYPANESSFFIILTIPNELDSSAIFLTRFPDGRDRK